MMNGAELTKRESEIAELFAWGASKKDIANRLYISERTVENHARNIYSKIGCQKVNELCAWWFCTTFHISFDLSPLTRKMVTIVCLCLMIPSILNLDDNNQMVRVRTTRVTTTRTVRSRRGRDGEDVTPIF